MTEHNRFDPFHISTLIIKLINGDISIAEQAELMEWKDADPHHEILLNRLLNQDNWQRDIAELKSYNTELALEQVLEKINHRKAPQFKSPTYKWLAAAAILICMGISFQLLHVRKAEPVKTVIAKAKPQPQIMLQLSDGRQVDIASLRGDTAIQQGTASISHKTGMLSYQPTSSKDEAAPAYNTLSVPRGLQYQLLLPDGTLVALNAGSSLRYPVVFNNNERIVELSGEAYFEVKHQHGIPFKVRSATQTVEVLGTHFNVQAYPEDVHTITTLAEGSVRVDNGRARAILKPGQMLAAQKAQVNLVPQQANLNDALAWTNGKISFSDDRLEDIMKKVARRYNVEVSFQGDVKNKRFWGAYPVNEGLQNLLKNLAQTHTVRFRLEGTTVVVMPATQPGTT